MQSRKVQAALLRHRIQPCDVVIGSPYNPALHERVGCKRAEGMGPLLVAEQQQEVARLQRELDSVAHTEARDQLRKLLEMKRRHLSELQGLSAAQLEPAMKD